MTTTFLMSLTVQSNPQSLTPTIHLGLTMKIHLACTVADLYDWTNDDIQNFHALVDTGAMVTCTGTKYIIYHYKPYTKLKCCLICLKAALSSNNSIISEGHGFLRICYANGYHEGLAYYHPNITGTLLSPTSVINSAREPNGIFTFTEMVQKWYNAVWNYDACLTSLSIKSAECCHSWLSVSRTAVTHPLIIPNVHPGDPRASLCNSFQLAWTQDKSFINSMQACRWCGNSTCKSIQTPAAQPILARHPSDVQRCQCLHIKANFRQDYSSICNQSQNRKAPMAPMPWESLWQVVHTIQCAQVHHWCSKSWLTNASTQPMSNMNLRKANQSTRCSVLQPNCIKVYQSISHSQVWHPATPTKEKTSWVSTRLQSFIPMRSD